MKRFSRGVIEVALVIGTVAGAASLIRAQQTTTSAEQRAGKEWLAVMDKDHDGTVDKKEFEAYMSQEFDKADGDHDGTLDATELGRLRMELASGIK